jgi:hypothetical protein
MGWPVLCVIPSSLPTDAALQNAASNGQEELLIPLLWACNEAEGAVTRLRETVKRLENEMTPEAWVGILDDAQVAQPRQANSPLDSGEQILTIDNRQEIAGRIVRCRSSNQQHSPGS